MKEGWIDDTYVILFEGHEEQAEITKGYELEKYLPGYQIQAISGWDDFIIRNQEGEQFRVPTVPLVQKYLEKVDQTRETREIEEDDRFAGKIKWYVKPVVFGGDPASEENMTWIDLKTHKEYVTWWNKVYQDVNRKGNLEVSARDTRHV
jgi:hypothetical protein